MTAYFLVKNIWRWVMGATALNIHSEPTHDIEIVMHVDETMVEEQRNDLAHNLEDCPGINSCFFCNNRFHLMLVSYDRNRLTSQDVLGKVKAQHYHAELIGPV
jgi:hypothetical protein